MKYNYLFLLKKLLLLKKHFQTVMLMGPKKIFTLSFYSTFQSVNIHIIRPNDQKTHVRCKVVGMDTGGLGAKHRNFFFFFMVESTQFCSFAEKTIK